MRPSIKSRKASVLSARRSYPSTAIRLMETIATRPEKSVAYFAGGVI